MNIRTILSIVVLIGSSSFASSGDGEFRDQVITHKVGAHTHLWVSCIGSPCDHTLSEIGEYVRSLLYSDEHSQIERVSIWSHVFRAVEKCLQEQVPAYGQWQYESSNPNWMDRRSVAESLVREHCVSAILGWTEAELFNGVTVILEKEQLLDAGNNRRYSIGDDSTPPSAVLERAWIKIDLGRPAREVVLINEEITDN